MNHELEGKGARTVCTRQRVRKKKKNIGITKCSMLSTHFARKIHKKCEREEEAGGGRYTIFLMWPLRYFLRLRYLW